MIKKSDYFLKDHIAVITNAFPIDMIDRYKKMLDTAIDMGLFWDRSNEDTDPLQKKDKAIGVISGITQGVFEELKCHPTEKDFALIRKKTDPDRLIYIRKILNKGYDDGEVRVKYANIHTVKGLTFDNVVVDLTATRQEDYFTQLRLKYVAYSRGKFDCWTVASQGKYTLGVR